MFAMNQRLVKGTDWNRKEASLGGDGDTGIPIDFKVHALATFLDLHENVKRSKKDFLFSDKRQKAQTALGVCFAAACMEAASGTVKGAPPSFFEQISLSIKPPARWAVFGEHLHFISIHFVHLLARWVQHYQKGLRELLKGFMFSIKMSIIILITVNVRYCVCIEFWV